MITTRVRIGAAAALALAGLLAGCTRTVAPPPAPPTRTHLIVYLRQDVTPAQKSAVQTRLRALPGGLAVTFVSREEAYRRFKEVFKDRPDVIAGASPDNLPESYEVDLSDAPEPGVLDGIRALPGVQQVTDQRPLSPAPTG